MRKFNLLILILTFNLTTTQINSQVIYSGSIREQIERWEGTNSKNIIDYVLKLQLQSFERKKGVTNNYFLVIRTEINGWKPVEYQITLREDNYVRDDNRLILIFEHPVGKSIREQYEELLKNKSDISMEDAASQILIKQDSIIVDSTFKYFDLINEMYTLELPIIHERIWIHGEMWSQVYMSTLANEGYSLFQFGVGDGEYKFPNWVERLFLAMIDHFDAIYPYPNIKKDK